MGHETTVFDSGHMKNKPIWKAHLEARRALRLTWTTKRPFSTAAIWKNKPIWQARQKGHNAMFRVYR